MVLLALRLTIKDANSSALSTYAKVRQVKKVNWQISSDLIASRAVLDLRNTHSQQPGKTKPRVMGEELRRGTPSVAGLLIKNKASSPPLFVLLWTGDQCRACSTPLGLQHPPALLSGSGKGNLSLVPMTAPGKSCCTSAFTAFCRINTTYRSLHIKCQFLKKERNYTST